MAQIQVSLSSVEEDRIEIYGSEGKLIYDRNFSERLQRTGRLSSQIRKQLLLNRIMSFVPGRDFRAKLRSPWREPSFPRAMKNFVEAIAAGESRSPDIGDAWRCLQVILAAEQANRDRAGTRGDPMNEIDLSVVLVTASDYRRLSKTVRHLADQDLADRMQLILVCQIAPDLEVPARGGAGIWRADGLRRRPLSVHRRTPSPGRRGRQGGHHGICGGSLLSQKLGGLRPSSRLTRRVTPAVGPSMHNANPATSLSWADLSLNFGPSVDQQDFRELVASLLAQHVLQHELFFANREDLATLLEAEGVLFRRLEDGGHTLYRTADAQVNHINIS